VDYDGTLLYSFKKHGFLMRLEMPALPEHLGLVNTGWNWDMEEARKQVVLNGHLDIGCQYYTADNTLRMVIEIPEDNYEITFSTVYTFGTNYKDSENTAIDWGDGSIDYGPFYYKENPYKNANAGHMYATAGRYTVVFKRLNAPNQYVGDYSTFVIEGYSDSDLVREIYYPKCPRSSSGCGEFWDIYIDSCPNLEILVYDPINIDSRENTSPAAGSTRLKHVVASTYEVVEDVCSGWANTDAAPIDELRPDYVELAQVLGTWEDSETGKEISRFYLASQSLQSISYPQITEDDSYDSISFMSPYAYNNGISYIRPPYHPSFDTIPCWMYGYIDDIQNILYQMPKTVTKITDGFLDNSFTQYSQTITIPEGITTIGRGFMSGVDLYRGAVITVRMPSTIATIGDWFVGYTASDNPDSSWWDPEDDVRYGYIHVDFRNIEHVPTLADPEWPDYTYIANKFITIIVPDELYKEWTTATNWATFYKDRIVKASEYVAPTES
jgi:hypothetical protein